MTSPENILLYLPEEQETAVRDLFDRLADLGFPRQHQRPHITVTFAPSMSDAVVRRAAEVLPALIPAQLSRVGTVVFGTKAKQTVAWLLQAPSELERAARELSALNADGRGDRWIPHLTVGLRLPRQHVPSYLAALDELGGPKTLTAISAGYWRPALKELRVLAG